MSIVNQIALSGLRASQVGIATTGQNIANVNTPGFSRLNPMAVSLAGQGSLNPGGGVQVTEIRRLTSNFLNQQLWRATTEQAFYQSSQEYLTSLEGLMAEEGSSISTGLDQFFAALNEATATPGSIALRQQVLAEADNLSQRFNGLSSNIATQERALAEQRVSMVTEINGLTSNIAELNQKIVEAEAIKGDTTALRDHRESLVTELSQYLVLRFNETPDGAQNLSLANGQPLVAGNSVAQLTVATDANGVQTLGLDFLGTQYSLKQDSLGGALGGLYKVEQEDLRASRFTINEMAGQFTQMVNDVLSAGFDLAGNAGQPLFVYDPNSISQVLTVNPLTAEQLAFSSVAGEAGNNENLLDLLNVKNQTISLGGNTTSMNDAYAGMMGRVASNSRQDQADATATTRVMQQAQGSRDAVSAVNLDEEAVNLMTYQQAYQANMKVITTANQMFDAILGAF